ncbi:hypothetical protein L227DRAFT_263285 [Lentinus tigrinus ALCF2SS1-6]|uniref:Uncharacterized protein n=1 Tax=Lentinus tigrinus ALCF2SS1-6 TaxID=1328759 RepID=A0A5C2SMY3_9APHY|nr:hypothetical protein L227DRAFT_263285 [Lentinus tigrinus ALCF2SS1-6]
MEESKASSDKLSSSYLPNTLSIHFPGGAQRRHRFCQPRTYLLHFLLCCSAFAQSSSWTARTSDVHAGALLDTQGRGPGGPVANWPSIRRSGRKLKVSTPSRRLLKIYHDIIWDEDVEPGVGVLTQRHSKIYPLVENSFAFGRNPACVYARHAPIGGS